MAQVELHISDLSRLVCRLENQDQSRTENALNSPVTTRTINAEPQTTPTDPSLLSLQNGLQSLLQGFQSALQSENQEQAYYTEINSKEPCIQGTRSSTISGPLAKASTPVKNASNAEPAKQADLVAGKPSGHCNQQ
jgi:hypothetical protein